MANHTFFLMLIFLPTLSFSQVEGRFGTNNLLLGKTGAATRPSLDAADINPAQAGLLSVPMIQLGWGYQSYTYSQRYPGFDSHSSSDSGLDSPVPIPKGFYRFNSRFGIGGLIIPFQLKQKIEVKELPIIVLGQQNLVNLNGEGTLKGYANIFGGLLVQKDLSLGFNLRYFGYSGAGDLVVNETGSNLASFAVEGSNLSVGLGIKYAFNRNLHMGMVTTIYRQIHEESTFKATLLSSEQNENTSTQTTTDYFNPIRIGVGIDLNRFTTAVDVEYERTQKDKTRYSVVDLTTKDVDIYDTWSFYSGIEYGPNRVYDILIGYFNEPSRIGPGKRGASEKTGFGFFDLAQNLGAPPEKPIWMASLGVRLNLMDEKVSSQEDDKKPANKKSKMDVKKERRKIFQKLSIETGVVYGESSIGIDENGEQPGAYLVKRYRVPVKVVYRF